MQNQEWVQLKLQRRCLQTLRCHSIWGLGFLGILRFHQGAVQFLLEKRHDVPAFFPGFRACSHLATAACFLDQAQTPCTLSSQLSAMSLP